MKIVEIWQHLENNAAQNIIFLPHYMWAENNKVRFSCYIDEAYTVVF